MGKTNHGSIARHSHIGAGKSAVNVQRSNRGSEGESDGVLDSHSGVSGSAGINERFGQVSSGRESSRGARQVNADRVRAPLVASIGISAGELLGTSGSGVSNGEHRVIRRDRVGSAHGVAGDGSHW